MKTKTIWLTGCTSGLGRALVDELTKAGHTIAGCGRRSNQITELEKQFPAPHYFTTADVSNDIQVQKFCSDAFTKTGSPDLLINNAGVMNEPSPLWDVSANEFDQLMAINVNGTANMIRHTTPFMIEQGQGIIVNMSSGRGRATSPRIAPYCTSKWAIEGLTQALAQELPPGMAAVALNPGAINTDMLQISLGTKADDYCTPEVWAKIAAPFLLAITPAQNGIPLTVI